MMTTPTLSPALADPDETEYLLSSPKNAARLLAALARANAETLPPQTVEELKAEAGLVEEEKEQ